MTNTSAITAVLFIITLIVLGPIVTIASLNTVFPALAIPSTFWTWAATGWLTCIVAGGLSKKD